MDREATETWQEPLLTGVVVHWHDPEGLQRLLAAWPEDPRFELVVVDNGGGDLVSPRGRLIRPGTNLGFAGGVNAGVAVARGLLVLLLNADARPLGRESLEGLLQGFQEHPEAAGLAPKLVGPRGESQHPWQLRPLPTPGRLVLQALFLAGVSGPKMEPPPGTKVEQPAAAALALRREVLQELGGLDEAFYPAWFEDVDLARRLKDRGQTIRYWPQAVFRHHLGSTVQRLGYGPFLWIYYRNLTRYLAKHHGASWAHLARALLPLALLLRLLALPLRRPRRAQSRREGASGLLIALAGALSGWRRPRGLARIYAIPPGGTGDPKP